MLELVRFGRLGQPYGAPFELVDQGPHHRLRAYATCADPSGPVALLVPPLMVTSEVYDIEPEFSAVALLGRLGVRPFVVDFGAPEREEGGMERTLDDHVIAVARSIERVRALTGRDVHLCGYSQGGMFAYQSAAFLRSEGVRSIVTFGSPVDIHKNLPVLHSDTTAALLRLLEPAVKRIFEKIEGLPGALTSNAFKLLSTRKEIQQRLEFVQKLHDRKALVRREARRRFLGGEGFVAWPGPAFRSFVEQFIVHNRMLSGGFVLDGRTVTLADIRAPILAFIGDRDELARPATVRAVAAAAPEAIVDFLSVEAGHFGLVVGGTATRVTWPTVAAWIHYREGTGPRPALLPDPSRAPARPLEGLDEEPEGAGFDVDIELDLFVDAIADTAKAAWRRLGDVASSASDAFDAVRYQEPRLRRLAQLHPDTRVSASLELADQARRTPDATFFLWRGRAFTYAAANERVNRVVRGLFACGVRPGQRVGVVMGSRPSFLSMVTALGRMGAVPVIGAPAADPAQLRAALAEAGAEIVATDPEHLEAARSVGLARVIVLGGGGAARELGGGVTDLEAIDPEAVELPDDLRLDAGLAREVALVLLRPGEDGALRAVPVTNHRVAMSALGAAAACTIKPEDTVVCAIPLHHPAGILVSVGAANAGGARLALLPSFDAPTFLADVRRYGGTVVFYAGEMLRPLVHQPPGRGDTTHPIRLFAGSGMRRDLWDKLTDRFGAGVMEFYASTSQRLVIANASGEKPGALGRALPGSVPTVVGRLVRGEGAARGELERDASGRVIRASVDEPGRLLVRLAPDESAIVRESVVADAFAPGDRWYATSDVVRLDADGDLWLTDTIRGIVAVWSRDSERLERVSTRLVEDALYALPEVSLASVWVEGEQERSQLVAAVVAQERLDPARVHDALAALQPAARPRRLVVVDALPLTEGFRPDKRAARALVADRPSLV